MRSHDLDRPDLLAVETEGKVRHQQHAWREPRGHAGEGLEILRDDRPGVHVRGVCDDRADVRVENERLQDRTGAHGNADKRDPIFTETPADQVVDSGRDVAPLEVPEREAIAVAIAVSAKVE